MLKLRHTGSRPRDGGCLARAGARRLRAGLFAVALGAGAAPGGDDGPPGYAVHPVGRVEVRGDKTLIVVQERYQPALLRLEDFSHVWVIWWFDRNDTPRRREILQVHPRRDTRNPLSGVFATRAPVRPNLIGLSLCRVISVNANRVEIDGIDAFDGTPVLDLKPYVPGLESVPDARTPARF